MPRDSATPSPTMSRPPLSRTSPTTAVTFEVPTSRPTKYRSFRATLPPVEGFPRLLVDAARRLTPPRFHSAPRLPSRSYEDAILEPHVHVLDLRYLGEQ